MLSFFHFDDQKEVTDQAKIVGFECKVSATSFQMINSSLVLRLLSQRNDEISSGYIQDTRLQKPLNPYCNWTRILTFQRSVLRLRQGEPSVSQVKTGKVFSFLLLKSSGMASGKNFKYVKFILIILLWSFGYFFAFHFSAWVPPRGSFTETFTLSSTFWNHFPLCCLPLIQNARSPGAGEVSWKGSSLSFSRSSVFKIYLP